MGPLPCMGCHASFPHVGHMRPCWPSPPPGAVSALGVPAPVAARSRWIRVAVNTGQTGGKAAKHTAKRGRTLNCEKPHFPKGPGCAKKRADAQPGALSGLPPSPPGGNIGAAAHRLRRCEINSRSRSAGSARPIIRIQCYMWGWEGVLYTRSGSALFSHTPGWHFHARIAVRAEFVSGSRPREVLSGGEGIVLG